MSGRQGVDQQRRVSDLVAAASSEEPAQLRCYGPLPQRWLALEEPERGQLALIGDDIEHGIDPKAADEFVLEIGMTDVEPKLGQRTGPDTCPAQRAGDATGFACITQAQQPVACAIRSVAVEEVDDAGRASHRYDRHPQGCQVMPKAKGQRLDRQPVTLALDKHRRCLHRTSMSVAQPRRLSRRRAGIFARGRR